MKMVRKRQEVLKPVKKVVKRMVLKKEMMKRKVIKYVTKMVKEERLI